MEYNHRVSQYGGGGQVLNTLLDDYRIFSPFYEPEMGVMDGPAGFAYVGPFNEKGKCFAYVA